MNSFISSMLQTATLENLIYFLLGVLIGLSIRPLFSLLTQKEKISTLCVKDVKLENDLTKSLYPIGYALLTKKTPVVMVFKKDEFKYLICKFYRNKKCVLDNNICKIVKPPQIYQPLKINQDK